MPQIWEKEELILLLDLYFDALDEENILTIKSPSDKRVDVLRKVLRKRDGGGRDITPAAVYLKLHDIAACDPDYAGECFSLPSQLDKRVFREYRNDRQRLKADAMDVFKSTMGVG